MPTAVEATPAAAAPVHPHDGILVGPPPIVDITALRKSYGTNEVLKGIDMKVARGEVICIIGKSGSGKSTLLRCVNGLEEFQEGALSVNGKKLLQRVGLAEKFDAMPDQLSGGQQQRVAIARALAMEPQVLLCDEITSALDPELVGEVLRVVESLAQEGMTLMMVTHEMAFARKVSDRVIFMHQGRVHEMGPPDQLFGSPQTPELRQFLSSLHD